jgi:pyruvate formate lyase activating enzyme
MAENVTGIVFNVQGYSIHDGPGIRTIVFLKGCPMRCLWCSNPESQNHQPEVEFFERRCVRCGQCLESCGRGAINPDLEVQRGHKIDRSLCEECGECSRQCPTGALSITGEEMALVDVLSRITKERAYFRKSGGGVTLSGGEPLAQPGFSRSILRACYNANIHTAVETAGHVPWRHFERILEFTDLVLYDIKHMDDALHRETTGVSNRLILENARRIARSGSQMVVRIPLIPGFSQTKGNLAATAKQVSGLGVQEIHLLPYHQFGRDKYTRLSREYSMEHDTRSVDLCQGDGMSALEAKAVLADYGLKVQIGG